MILMRQISSLIVSFLSPDPLVAPALFLGIAATLPAINSLQQAVHRMPESPACHPGDCAQATKAELATALRVDKQGHAVTRSQRAR